MAALLDQSRPGTPSGIDEDALLAGLRAGDDRAYEEMVRAFGGRLLAVAQRILRNEDDARDAVQTAYLSAFRSIARFEAGCRLSTWLHRIVVNAALMKLRSRRRRPEESIEPLLPTYLDDGHHVEQFSKSDLPADAALERDETRAVVRACIAQLPDSVPLDPGDARSRGRIDRRGRADARRHPKRREDPSAPRAPGPDDAPPP